MLHTGLFLAYHIGMALQDENRDILLSGRCRLYDDDIACLIGPAFKRMRRRKILKISDDKLFVPRLPRHTDNFLEDIKNSVGIHIVLYVFRPLTDILYRPEDSIFSMSETYCLKVLSVDIRSDTVVHA